MKKRLLGILMCFFAVSVFAQTHSTVDINDTVYSVLQVSAEKGYCQTLYSAKPYSESYIVAKLDEIIETIENMLEEEDSRLLEVELDIVKSQKEKFNHQAGLNKRKMEYRHETQFGEGVPVTFNFNDTVDGLFTTGLYDGLYESSKGYEVVNNFNFTGDITKNFSYKVQAYAGLTSMPLQDMGQYAVGSWWYDYKNDDSGTAVKYGDPDYGYTRHIKIFRNNNMLPYSYKKFWDGNVFLLSNFSASGTEGWADGIGLGFGMNGEMRSSFFDNKVEISLGRNSRDWGSMDTGSSLILNGNAHPFLAGELAVRPLKWLSLSTITGVLEFPNQDFINEATGDNFKTQDSYYFQNAYSMAIVDMDLDHFHFDFGSAVVWPKRFEMGYMFPLIDNVVYQDNIGDYDNLCLFGDFMFRKEGVGKVWLSGYLDEMPKPNPKKLFKKTRYMFAMQTGGKVVIPWLPFASLSLRYTKIEPYCYTHHSINYTPWYGHYISESYTNNGESLGYYLPPNSDEFHIRLEANPISTLSGALQYQLIRHGADFGSRAVPGSSLYSELPPEGRDSLNKYFLKDGCYEWSHIISLGGSYDLRKYNIPLKLNMVAGYVYDYFTDTTSPVGSKGSYNRVENSEYKTSSGVVISVGFTAFGN